MKPARLRTFSYFTLYSGILLILLIPLYMYFSDDVAKLKDNYPHIIPVENSQPDFIIKPSKPNHWVQLKAISSYARWAIVLSEDWSFYQHEGIDVDQIKAAFNDMIEGERFRGASTITQQMVKNVYLTGERSIWRKIHEIILAQKVERVLSKDRILEIYLNSIEFGPNIYGIKNASYHYFRKHPSSLNPKESAFLAMLLPSPKRYYISYKNKTLTPFARQRINAILNKMKMGKVLSGDQYESQKLNRLSWEQ
jgi:monofunctional biosynthetic peptidoglycan transglycosylase